MERRNFLRAALLSAAGMSILQSCEDPLPYCERERVGTVSVKNSTGYNIWTDVTWGNVTENSERLVYNGNTSQYDNIPAGSIEIWVSFDGSDWYYEYENLSACEDMTFTWYLDARKSADTNECRFAMVGSDGNYIEAKKGANHPRKQKTWETMRYKTNQ